MNDFLTELANNPAITTGQLIDIMLQAFRIASTATPASVASV